MFSERKFDWYAERVHFAREQLDREFASEFTVSELARSVGMSMFHFTRVFTELTGMPPHRYLLATRLKAARAMLRDGRSVTETCFACGFSNLSHFSRSFARRLRAYAFARLCLKFSRPEIRRKVQAAEPSRLRESSSGFDEDSDEHSNTPARCRA